MKFWESPLHGTGTHSYYANGYGTQSANFGEATYFWNLIPDAEPTIFTAHLLYHLGVSVNMGYGADGSGTYSHLVPNAMTSYFNYSSSIQYIQRSGYSTTSWMNSILKPQLDAGKPVYYSGNDGEGGHAFVCDGYDENDFFSFNFGWSGSNNGYYGINDVNGFMYGNAVVRNFVPAETENYPEAPASLTAELDTEILDDFTVELEWTAPASKDVTGYKIFRDFEEIASLPAATLNYTDITETANYNYIAQAIYGNEESLATLSFLSGVFSITFYAKDPSTQSNISMADVTFNGETIQTGFMGAQFHDTPFGGEYAYTVTHPDYPETSGVFDVTEHKTINVIMDGSNEINEINSDNISIYPNPVDEELNIKCSEKANYEIIDVTGKIICSGMINSNMTKINLQNESSGYYIIKVKTNNEIINKSFIVK